MNAGKLQEILDRSYEDLYDFREGEVTSKRRGASLLPDGEREELDLFLSHSLTDDDPEEMGTTLNELESILGEDERGLELLKDLREEVARTAFRCIELAYRFGKRRGGREALDLLLPYIQDKVGDSL